MIGIKLELDKSDMQKIDFILKNFDKKLGKKTLVKAFRVGAKPIVQQAKQNAPVSSKKTFLTSHRHVSKGVQSTKLVKHNPGELKRSIGVIRGRDGRSIYIGPRLGSGKANDAWYAHFIEFGTDSTGWGKGIQKNPFMRPAWDTKQKTAQDLISKELSRVVDEYLKRNK